MFSFNAQFGDKAMQEEENKNIWKKSNFLTFQYILLNIIHM